jgi:hypothetical protein
MNNKISKIEDDQRIESIIYAFQCNFYCAIKRSQHDSFVVAQLSACLLEQFSGFLYAAPADQRVEQFVATYMEPYSELGLYTILQNNLDHRLVEKLGTVMIGIPGRLLKNGWVGLDERKVIDVFTKNLEDAVKKAAMDLRSDEHKKRHALAWLRDHPVYECKSTTLYTSRQQWELVKYYQPLLQKHIPFAAATPLSFGFNFGDGGYFIAVLIDNFCGREETSRVPLEIFIELLGLKRPEEVLSEQE